MKKTTKLMCLALSAVMAFGLVGCGKKTNTADNTTYKIGLSGPLTGPAATYGTAVQNSAQMAIEEINTAGGFDGVKFELLSYDDANDSSKIATNFNTMLEKGMNFSLGTVTTKPGLEYKELANDENVFFITPSASGDDITKYDTGFQMCYADSHLGTASAEYFNEHHSNDSIGVFYQADNDYSKGVYTQFMKTIDRTIFPDIKVASFLSTTTGYNQQANDLKECDVIFMPIYFAEAQLFMKQAKDVNMLTSVYFGADGFDGLVVPEGVEQEVSMLTHFASNATTGPAKTFIDKYVAKYGKETLNQFGAAAYDCVYSIYEAMKFAKAQGKEFSQTTTASDFADILKGVYTNNEFVFHGITGECEGENKSNITWSKTGTVQKKAEKFVIHESAN